LVKELIEPSQEPSARTSKDQHPISREASRFNIQTSPMCVKNTSPEEGAEQVPLIVGGGLALCTKGEIKGGALADGSFGPDGPAVPAHNPFHRRQADACAFEVLGPMQSLKNAE
jgi:hypothetical protein